jgi:hypothetical protein
MSDIDEKLIIHWVGEIPVANLKAAVEEMLPPGDWVYFDHFKNAIDEAITGLTALHGDSMRGRLRVCISRTLDQIALLELPGLQNELELTQKVNAVDFPKSSDQGEGRAAVDASSQLRETSKVIQEALVVGESLLAKNDAGEYPSAENFMEALEHSPDPKLTANALKIAGSGGALHGVEGSFYPRAHKRFPELLESTGVFRMRFSDCVDVGPNEVKADFKRLHTEGQSAESSIGQLMKFRQRLPIALAGSQDAPLFRVGAAAEFDLDAEVTVTVSSYERTIKRFTLVRLINREDTLRQLDGFIEQLRLPMGERM